MQETCGKPYLMEAHIIFLTPVFEYTLVVDPVTRIKHIHTTLLEVVLTSLCIRYRIRFCTYTWR